MSFSADTTAGRTVDLEVHPLTHDAFAPYGQLVAAFKDGKTFGPDEPQLHFGSGTPRFYILSLDGKPLAFKHITRHVQVTQCLASVGGKEWLVAVAPPSAGDDPNAKPDLAHLKAFRVPGDVGIMLYRGTWHAGPFFDAPRGDFFNLELADTNQVDHQNSHLVEDFGVSYRFAI